MNPSKLCKLYSEFLNYAYIISKNTRVTFGHRWAVHVHVFSKTCTHVRLEMKSEDLKLLTVFLGTWLDRFCESELAAPSLSNGNWQCLPIYVAQYSRNGDQEHIKHNRWTSVEALLKNNFWLLFKCCRGDKWSNAKSAIMSALPRFTLWCPNVTKWKTEQFLNRPLIESFRGHRNKCLYSFVSKMLMPLPSSLNAFMRVPVSWHEMVRTNCCWPGTALKANLTWELWKQGRLFPAI